jgi:hypothetical protein
MQGYSCPNCDANLGWPDSTSRKAYDKSELTNLVIIAISVVVLQRFASNLEVSETSSVIIIGLVSFPVWFYRRPKPITLLYVDSIVTQSELARRHSEEEDNKVVAKNIAEYKKIEADRKRNAKWWHFWV